MALTVQERNSVLALLPDDVAKEYVNGRISEDQLEQLAIRTGVRKTKESAKPKPKSLDNSRNALDTAGDAVQSGLRRTGAGMIQQGIDADRLREREEADPWYKRDVLDFVGFGPDERARADADIAAKLQGYKKGETYSDIQRRMEAQATAEEQAVAQDVASVRNPVLRALTQGATDAASSPLSYLSVFGGPAGALSGADAYARTYREARKAGVSIEEAEKIARERQAVESAIGMVPAAKLLGPLSKLGRGVTGGTAAKFAGRTATNMAGEGLNEVLTEAVNAGLDFERSKLSDDQKVREYSKEALPKNIANEALRTFIAGAIGGGVMSAPGTGIEIHAENGRLAADMLAKQAEAGDLFSSRRKPKADTPRTNEIQPQTDLFGEIPQQQEQPIPPTFADAKARFDLLNQSIAQDRDALERLTADFGQMMGTTDSSRDPALLEQITGLRRRIQAKEQAAGRALRAMPPEFAELGLDTPEQPKQQPQGIIKSRGGDTYYTPDGQQRSLIMDVAQQDAAKALEKSRKNDKKAAEKKMKAELQKLTTRLTNEAKAMQGATDEQRVKHIAQGVAEFKRTAKLEDFAPQPKAAKIPAARTNGSKPARAAEPVMSTEDLMKSLGPDATLAQEGSTETTGVTADQVVRTIKKNIGKSRGNTAAKLIGDGNLVVLDDASQIPSDAAPLTSAGFYDGKRTYVVANQLDAANVMGDLLSIAAHETKHGADLAGGKRVKATLGNFIGTTANGQIVRKIEAMAASGDPLATEVVKAAKKGSTDETYALELPAYYINFARAQRDASPAHRRLTDNVVSAVRNAAKRAIGSDDVNLKDVAYLSDKLLRETAESGERMDMGGNADMPMFADSNAKGFDKAKARGRVYPSADGVEKFFFSDNDSSINGVGLNLLRGPDSWREGVAVGDLLNHPELYKNYPDVKEVRVYPVKFSKPGTNGMFSWSNVEGEKDYISLSEKLIEPSARAEERIRSVLLHEIQHWIQRQSFERAEHFYNEEFVKTAEQRSILNDNAIAQRDTRNAAKALLEAVYNEIVNVRNPNISNEEMRKFNEAYGMTDVPMGARAQILVNELGVGNLSGMSPDVQHAVEAFTSAHERLIDSHKKAEKVNDELYKRYRNNITEAEAFYVQQVADLREDQVPVNPEAANNLNRPALEGDAGSVLRTQTGLAFDANHLREGLKRLRSPDNKIMDALRKGFSGYGAMGRELAATKELADGFAALRAHNGMNHFHEINRGITQAAKLEVSAGRAKDQESAEANIRGHVEQVMKTMEKEDSEQRRISMMNALVRRYPSLKGFPRAVQEVNELSRTIVRQMLEANPNPTEEERRLMQTIMSNTFRYTTRMYAAFQGEAGRAYSKRVKKEYEKALKAVNNGKAVPPKYKESFDKWKNAAEYLIENDLTIPDESEIGGTSTDRLTRLYDTWVGDANRIKSNAKAEALSNGMTKREADQAAREAMIAGLLERAPDISSAEMQGMADNLIIGMLGLQDAGGPFASYYRGFKQDRGILEQREQLPQEIRDLFGEVQDPATRLAITIAKQGELAGRTRLLLDMKHNGTGKWVIKAADRGKPGNERFSVQLNGKGYGPLDGYYTTPAIASSISDSLEMFSTMGDALAKGYQNSDAIAMAMARGATNGIVKMAGLQKLLTVVADVYNMGMNAFGSPIVLVANGIYNPLLWVGGAKVAAQVIWDTGMQGGVELSPHTQDAIRYGVLDSARVQEIRRTPQQFVRNLISTSPRAITAGKSAWNRGTRTGIEMFAMADAWVKIVAFQERTNTLREFYKAEGIKKTDHELKAEAADQIKDTNITYARTGAVVRGLERVGATTFMPYFVSVPRAIAYNVSLASKDMIRALGAKSPEAKMTLGMAAVRRMSGTAVATAGVVFAMKALAAAVNDEDEEKIAAMQKLMFPDARFADSFFLGYDEKGIPMFARFSRIDPFGPVNDFMRILFDEHTATPEKQRHVAEMFKDLLITNRVLVTGGQVALDMFTDAQVDISRKEVKLERMGPKTTAFIKDKMEAVPGLDDNDAESMIAFIDSFTPGIADMFDPNNRGIAKESEDGAALLGAIITYTGGRMDRADPELAAYAAGKKLDDIRKAGRRRQADGLKAGESISTLQSRFLEDAREEYDAMRDVADVWEGMREGIDLSPRKSAEIMKNDGRLKEEDIRGLHYGRLSLEADQWIAKYSRLISVDSQRKAAIGTENRKQLTPEEKRKIREYLLNMRALGYKVQE